MNQIDHGDNVKLQKRASILILGAALLVLGLKAAAYFLMPSAALLSDALETMVNVLSGIVMIIVINFVSQPADLEHPYGHGKAEFVSAAFEGGLVFSAALLTLAEAVRSLFSPHPLDHMGPALAMSMAAGGFNLLIGLYVKGVAKRTQSEALKASSFHLLSDVKTTVAIFVGLVLAHWTGWKFLDSLLAAGVGIVLIKESYVLIKDALGGLIDRKEDIVLKDLVNSFDKHRFPGLVDIHQVRVIRSGNFHHIDAHIVLPRFWKNDETHDRAQEYEESVISDYKFEGEIAFHVDPCLPVHCVNCDLQTCQVRSLSFDKLKTFSIDRVVLPPKESELDSELKI